ncbi:MAG: hypothetical protein IKP50_00300 [Bacilli bacterium]|nr:hypothetical protein [Bacilli bacterium]
MSIESNQVYTCCICGETFTGWGNNPWPLSDNEDDRCCDDCNNSTVLSARLEMMFKNKQ